MEPDFRIRTHFQQVLSYVSPELHPFLDAKELQREAKLGYTPEQSARFHCERLGAPVPDAVVAALESQRRKL